MRMMFSQLVRPLAKARREPTFTCHAEGAGRVGYNGAPTQTILSAGDRVDRVERLALLEVLGDVGKDGLLAGGDRALGERADVCEGGRERGAVQSWSKGGRLAEGGTHGAAA